VKRAVFAGPVLSAILLTAVATLPLRGQTPEPGPGQTLFNEHCVLCHGAPGLEPSELAKGLYPHPPLLERKKHLQVGAVYWIVKNGVRDTGMPAFGPTHDEQELWAIAAFTAKMPHLTPAQYLEQARAAGVEKPGGAEMDEPMQGQSGPPAAAPPHGPG